MTFFLIIFELDTEDKKAHYFVFKVLASSKDKILKMDYKNEFKFLVKSLEFS